MDGWSYALWQSAIRERIEQLSRAHDIFYCSVGNDDHSFEFVYYEDGRLKRKYIVEDPTYEGGEVVEELGTPLANEALALQEEDELDKVLSVAKSLGIEINHSPANIRTYRIIALQ
jgi:hypothetical protein